MRAFSAPLYAGEVFQELRREMKKDKYILEVSGCADAQEAHLISCLTEGLPGDCRLIVAANEDKAKKLYEDLSCFDDHTVVYPSRDILFYSADIRGSSIVGRRIEVMKQLLTGEPLTILCGIDVLLEKMIPPEVFRSQILLIDYQSTIDIPAFRTRLTEIGYENTGLVERPGEFGIRGGIIDIFPLTEENPVRIELWGEEIDSIRAFNPETQRSIRNLDKVILYPASEMILSQESIGEGVRKIREEYRNQELFFQKEKKREEKRRLRQTVDRLTDEITSKGRTDNTEGLIGYFYKDTVSLLDYLPSDTRIIIDEAVRIDEAGKGYEENFISSMTQRLEGGYVLPGQTGILFSYEETVEKLKRRSLLLMSTLSLHSEHFKPQKSFEIPGRSVVSYQGSLPQLAEDLKDWKEKGYRIILLSSSGTRARRLAENLRDYDLFTYYVDDPSRLVEEGEVVVMSGRLSSGFEYPSLRFVVLTEKDIFKEKKKKKRRKQTEYQGEAIRSVHDIAVGDYVVHERYGLGVYQGMEQIERHGVLRDYINIEYADGGVLHILASQLDVVQKYASVSGKAPKLNSMGGNDWIKTRNRVRKQIQIAARDLVALYARREGRKGHAYSPDTIWQQEFEERFPYEETEDQLHAIVDVKRDMEEGKIMDRLICGDVGYGKTEVAIRAAFKAVMDSKQVVFLVPTTILAQQHYHSFVERMEDYPIEIAVLSRFCSAREVTRIQKGLKNGSIDIVIGTHKVLSKKIQYRDLGLLIIDEEQRFGVRQKEKIKQLREDVDVLSLSATPIPRTLHMSMSGIRDMSVLEIPPVDRRAIQTYVMEYNEELVREAISRELHRNGQVYYVYNRVSTIPEVRDRVQKLVPDAVVEYAHGRMGERELEDIMFRFVEGEIDVLVSTTIIETGLDIPNVNTIIVEDAHRYGLAQLYQLRGRVGRSSRNAYAFLMYRRNELLKEQAEKRLKAIREFTDLGSGFKIAMRDLEIRGAGNLLGAEQSGHMEAVGYELYCKMLSEAVRELTGEEGEKESFESSVNLPVNAYIPRDYIPMEAEKLFWYKRIAAIKDQTEYDDMIDELTDRYGDVPQPVIRLMDVALLKERAHSSYIMLIEQKGDSIRFVMNPKARVKVEEIDGFLKEYPGRMKILTAAEPTFVWTPDKEERTDLLAGVAGLTDRISLLLEPDF